MPRIGSTGLRPLRIDARPLDLPENERIARVARATAVLLRVRERVLEEKQKQASCEATDAAAQGFAPSGSDATPAP